ncbi:MAG: aminoglycoside phosphotransferase family protein [Acidimicrobiia bacterium]|nr:aminoglycoside phosphotransferase family protein [Acidimicrobiia bacterium]
MDRHPNQRAASTLPRELRRTTVPDAVRSWVASVAGARVERVRRLPGATSTAVHGLWLAGGDRLVLRRYAWPGFLAEEPDAPRREIDALRYAAAHDLPVPEIVGADVGGHEVGDGVPTLLMTFLPGRARATPDVADLAAVAAQVHAAGSGPDGHDWFRWYEGRSLAPPALARHPHWWEVAIERWNAEPPPFVPSLTHRDFHPGNVLWSRSRATGIVDWANACRGPWSCDIAHCRGNLINLSGFDAADRFLAAYEAQTGKAYDWFWELGSVLEHGPSSWEIADDVTSAERRLDRALAELGLR